MVCLSTSVRAALDPRLQRLQFIAHMHYRKYKEDPYLLTEFRDLLATTCQFVDDWNDERIGSPTYRLYGKRVPAIEATTQFVNSTRQQINTSNLREKTATDIERNIYSHSKWVNASSSTSIALNKKVKEPYTLLFFKDTIYEFSYNKEGHFSQAQMGLLYDLPSRDDIDRDKPIKILVAPPGLHDIVFDDSLSKEEYLNKGFIEKKSE